MLELIDFGVSPNGRIMFSLERDGGSHLGDGGARVAHPTPGGRRRSRMRHAVLALVAVAVAATVVIAGCGESSRKSSTVGVARRQLTDLQQTQHSIETRLHAVPAHLAWAQLPGVCASLAPEEATLADGVKAVVWPTSAQAAADRLHIAAAATATRLADCAKTTGSPRSLAAASTWANAAGDAAVTVGVRLTEVSSTV